MVDFVTMFITPFQQAEGCFEKPRSNDTITTRGKPFAKFTFNTHSFNDFPRFQAGKATLITRSPKSQHLHPQARLMENGLGEINIPKECSFISGNRRPEGCKSPEIIDYILCTRLQSQGSSSRASQRSFINSSE